MVRVGDRGDKDKGAKVTRIRGAGVVRVGGTGVARVGSKSGKGRE